MVHRDHKVQQEVHRVYKERHLLFPVLQGPIGPVGPAGAAGTGFNWRGPWNSAASYNPNDATSYNGTRYVAIAQNTNQELDIADVPSANITFTITFNCAPGTNGTYTGGQAEGCYSAPCEVIACKALARATPRCAKAPVQQLQTMPLRSMIF